MRFITSKFFSVPMRLIHRQRSGMICAVFCLFFSSCSSVLYAPTHNFYVKPERLNLKYHEVSLHSQGKTIYGWHFTESVLKKPKGFLIFFHGNGQNRSSHYLALSFMLEQGYDYFIFDYQGYGESEGKPSPEGTVKDGLEAMRWFLETAHEPRYAEVPLFVFAQSLGGAVALKTLEEYQTQGTDPAFARVMGVILDSSFLTYRRTGAKLLSKHWLTYLLQPFSYLVLSDRWAPKAELANLPHTRYLVMHGDQDQTIDFHLGDELFQALPEPKTFLRIEGGTHISSLFIREGEYREAFLKWMETP